MMDSFNRQVLRVAVAQICQSMGWDALQKSTHDTLTDVMQKYLEEIGKVAYGYTQLCNRTKPNLDDLHLAFQDTGVAVHELENYVAQVDPVPFIHPFTTYPRCKPCRLQHPSKGEFVDRADFYSEHLPPLPKVCEEPKDEGEKIASEENAKVLDQPEVEKMKASPLKESNHIEVKENVLVKRPHEAPIFSPENKRLRIDIPLDVNLEKKENLENTDVESLSPATPVSPYLPQELPKPPDEPAKEVITVKVKTEPKKVSNLTKELVLPLTKTSVPDEKMKSETVTNAKKPKIKSDKSASPKIVKKSPLSSARSESSLSNPNIPKTSKKSPSPKLKSPVKSRSPVIDKPSTPVKKISEKLSVKQESSMTSPVKGSPSKKFKSSAAVKKENSAPAVKQQENKQLTKKKKKVFDKTDGLKSPREEVSRGETSCTPKLMIKLLPQPDVSIDSSKSNSKEAKSSGSPAKMKIPITPESKTKIKIKTKSSGDENIPKPLSKVKLSTGSYESDIKKEHNRKKKKKKDKEKDRDKDREKHKTIKAGKAEPPIPKIRFKLDPSGESKVVETKSTAAPKSTGSSAQASSKQSSIMIETEKVSTSIITETVSNTLDYDPSKAYYCPVCNKQDDGSPMVGCDGCDEWCHWACVGLIAAPPEDEEWYCPQCLLRREKSKKNKIKKKT